MKMNIKSVRFVVITDDSFANAPGLKSQLGYIVLLAGDERLAYIVPYGSSRRHCVTRSVMVAEVHTLAHAIDVGMVI